MEKITLRKKDSGWKYVKADSRYEVKQQMNCTVVLTSDATTREHRYTLST